MGLGEVGDILDGTEQCNPSGWEGMADDMREQEAQDSTPVSVYDYQ